MLHQLAHDGARAPVVIPPFASSEAEPARSAATPVDQLLESHGLTRRECDVVRLLITTGDPDKLIARRLGSSVHTVKIHLSRARAKLGARNRVDLALIMIRGLWGATA